MAERQSSNPRKAKSIRTLVSTAKSEGHDTDAYTGKREHTRYATGMRLEIALDPAKPEDATPVVMHNVSEGGFAFWYRRELTPPTTVFLRECDGATAGEWLPALVRHCTRGLLGYLVGAEFECAGTNSPETPFVPSAVANVADSKAEHLRRLVRRQLAAKKR